MTDLRADLIDDIAEVFREAGHDEPFATQYATVCIDRGLDTLADRADEWKALAYNHEDIGRGPGLASARSHPYWPPPAAYVAVLRGDT